MTANRLALEAKKDIPEEQWIHLYYEDLFVRPVDMFREVFDKLEIPFTREIEARCTCLQPTSIVRGSPQRQKWKKRNPEAIERILPLIRPMLEEMGYDPDE